MQSKFCSFRLTPSVDVAQFFNLNEEEAKLERILKYSKGLATSTREFGLPFQSSAAQLPPPTPSRAQTNVPRASQISVTERLYRTRISDRDRLANILNQTLGNLQRTTESLRALNDARDRRRTHDKDNH